MTASIVADDARVGGPTICERLADHVVDLRYDEIPIAITAKAKQHLLHLFGTAFRGRSRDAGEQAIRAAVELSGPDGRCTIVGDRRRANELDAVFANSILMATDGLEDAVLPPGVHPGIVIQPVAWAFGERNRTSGRELLVSIVVGYDVLTTLCDPVWTWTLDPPRRPNSVVAPFGAAATAARLLGLTRAETAFALGHAGQMGMGIPEGSSHMWTSSPLLARNGAMAAVMAGAGIDSSLTVVEGTNGVYEALFRQVVPDELHHALGRLGHDFAVARATMKRQPASLLNFVPLELAQGLVDEQGIRPADVAEVVVSLPAERAPREATWESALTEPGADYRNRLGSLRFRVAMILCDGTTDLARCEAVPDATLLEMLGKTRLAFEEDRPLAYARIDVTTVTGGQLTVDGDNPAQVAVDWSDWLSVGGNGLLIDEQRARLVELVEHLEDVEDVGEVLACVVPPTADAPS